MSRRTWIASALFGTLLLAASTLAEDPVRTRILVVGVSTEPIATSWKQPWNLRDLASSTTEDLFRVLAMSPAFQVEKAPAGSHPGGGISYLSELGKTHGARYVLTSELSAFNVDIKTIPIVNTAISSRASATLRVHLIDALSAIEIGQWQEIAATPTVPRGVNLDSKLVEGMLSNAVGKLAPQITAAASDHLAAAAKDEVVSGVAEVADQLPPVPGIEGDATDASSPDLSVPAREHGLPPIAVPNGGTAAGGTFTLIAMSGDQAPGLEAGEKFLEPGNTDARTFSTALLNETGEVAVRGFVTGSDGGPHEGFWAGRAGDLRLVWWSGTKVSGPIEANASTVYAAAGENWFFDGNGRVTFPDSLGRILQGGSTGLRGPFTVRGASSSPSLDAVHVNGDLVAFDKGKGVWAGPPEDLRSIARKGDSAPGMPGSGIVFDSFEQVVSAGEHYFFSAFVSGRGVTAANCHGLWLRGKDGTRLVLASGSPTGSGGQWNKGWPIAVNAGGQVFLNAMTEDPKPGWLLTGRPGDLKSLKWDGGPPPPPLVFGQESLGWLLDDGTVLLPARGLLMWLGQPVSMRTLQYWAHPAPGVEGGKFLRSGDFRPVVTPKGLIAFLAMATFGADAKKISGIWAGAPDKLRLVVRDGDWITIRPGDKRRVAQGGIALYAPRIPQRWATQTSFNDRGQIVVVLTFEPEPGVRDKSQGVFIATVPGSPAREAP